MDHEILGVYLFITVQTANQKRDEGNHAEGAGKGKKAKKKRRSREDVSSSRLRGEMGSSIKIWKLPT